MIPDELLDWNIHQFPDALPHTEHVAGVGMVPLLARRYPLIDDGQCTTPAVFFYHDVGGTMRLALVVAGMKLVVELVMHQTCPL
jgi:hypothetical protein